MVNEIIRSNPPKRNLNFSILIISILLIVLQSPKEEFKPRKVRPGFRPGYLLQSPKEEFKQMEKDASAGKLIALQSPKEEFKQKELLKIFPNFSAPIPQRGI